MGSSSSHWFSRCSSYGERSAITAVRHTNIDADNIVVFDGFITNTTPLSNGQISRDDVACVGL